MKSISLQSLHRIHPFTPGPILATLSLTVLLTCKASATMIADSMTLDWRYPNASTHSVFSGGYPYSFTVGPGGTTFTHGYNPALTVSVDADTITIAFPLNPSYPVGQLFGFSGGVPFNGAVFTDLTRDFLSVAIDSVTALPGFDSSRVWIDENDLYVNFAGLTQANGVSSATLRVTTASVPESVSTGSLCAAAFILLAGAHAVGRRTMGHNTMMQQT